MPTVSRAGFDLQYDEAGTGPVIVWVPGTGLRGRTWQAQVNHFRDRYRCVTVDLRGSGGSGGGDTSFTVADLADDVAAVLDELAVPRATVVGLSLGSAVAQELALRRPDLVAALGLLATWSSTAREHHVRRHFTSRLYAIEHGPLDVYAQFAFWMSAPSLYDFEPELQVEVERQLQDHMSSTPAGTAGHFRADLGHETRDRLHLIGCPTLVVHGAEDLITLPWYNRTVAELVPGATLEVIEGAGHLAWLERPTVLTGHLEGLLVRAAQPTG